MASVKKRTQGFSVDVTTRPRHPGTKPELPTMRRLGRNQQPGVQGRARSQGKKAFQEKRMIKRARKKI